MIEIKIFMNSSVEDVLAFKTCCGLKAFDQNLEIHIRNRSDQPVTIHSHFDLHGSLATKRIDNLMPQGPQIFLPGELKAFYCFMDENIWGESERLTFYDTDGNIYEASTKSAD